LSKFTGFGASALANALFGRAGEIFPAGWEVLGGRLEELLSREDLASLARSTQYAHYTPEFIIRAMWRAILRLGFSGGSVLEPGCGSGLFFALMPESLAGTTSLTGIEADVSTARIARLLYPGAFIRHEDFTKARLPETYDLVISNPPFSDRTVRADNPAGRLSLSLHDYFIARSIERLKEGGLAAFVTSRWTLDKADPKARDHIASMANLIGAIRLPQGAMNAAAGTDVVADILFLRKRFFDEPPAGPLWNSLEEALPAGEGEPALSISRYFLDHPDMVLGRHARTSSPFGPVYACLKDPQTAPPRPVSRPPSAGCRKAFISRLGKQSPSSPAARMFTSAPPPKARRSRKAGYILDHNELFQIIGGRPTPIVVRKGKAPGQARRQTRRGRPLAHSKR